ncbi:MAG: protoporphyrinogen/coproporphyrinogen oxidase [Planctomycetota bacterium]
MASPPGRIVIVGAGMAGLGAGLTLQRAGRQVTILERLDAVGGLAKSVAVNGHVFDVGPHYFFLDVSEDVNDLVRSSVRPEEWRPIDFKISAIIGRQNVPWPPTASAVFKLPASGIYRFLQNALKANVPDALVARQFLEDCYGSKMYRIFLGPYLKKKVPPAEGAEKLHRDWWNQTLRTIDNVPDVKRDKMLQLEPALVKQYLERYPQPPRDPVEEARRPPPPRGMKRAMRIFSGLFRTAFAKNYKQVLYPPGGVGVITERMAEQFEAAGGELHLRASNVEIERDGRRVSRVSWDAGAVDEPDQVVWTGSVHRLCTMLDVPREELPFMTILLGMMTLHRPLKNGEDLYTYVAHPDIVFNRIYYPNRSVPGLCPEGRDSVCVEITPYDERDVADPERLTERVKAGLARMKVCKPEDIDHLSYMFVPDSYPVYPLDYREKLARIWEELDQFENIRSIGRSGQFWYNNMARSMRAGIETAQAILGDARA